MKLEFSPEAIKDLEGIAAFIAMDSALAAERMLGAIREKCLVIAAQPLLYAPQDEFPGYRRALAKPFGIWFRVVDNDIVRVERVVHGARDLPTLFDLEA